MILSRLLKSNIMRRRLEQVMGQLKKGDFHESVEVASISSPKDTPSPHKLKAATLLAR